MGPRPASDIFYWSKCLTALQRVLLTSCNPPFVEEERDLAKGPKEEVSGFKLPLLVEQFLRPHLAISPQYLPFCLLWPYINRNFNRSLSRSNTSQ